MNQQPDKFFREKLEGFQKTAPALAWEKIEAGLDKKNNKGLWLKIAAAVLLLATATFVLWSYRNTSEQTQQTAVREIEKKVSPEQEIISAQQPVADNQVESSHVESNPVKEKVTSPKSKVNQYKLKITSQDNVVAIQQVADDKEVKNDVPENVEPEIVTPVEAIVESDPVVADNSSSEDAESINLVYSAEEVNDKYLDKVALAKATSSQKKPSTFRKLLDKAYDLKNNQDPFGDLRQKKNEILALNFKSEKRSQNK